MAKLCIKLKSFVIQYFIHVLSRGSSCDFIIKEQLICTIFKFSAWFKSIFWFYLMLKSSVFCLSDFVELTFASPSSPDSVPDHPQDLCSPQLRQLLSPIFNPITPPPSSSPPSSPDLDQVNTSLTFF